MTTASLTQQEQVCLDAWLLNESEVGWCLPCFDRNLHALAVLMMLLSC